MFRKLSLLMLCSGVLLQSDAEAGWWFSKSAKARMNQQDWDEGKAIWSLVIGKRVSEELEEVDPASADAVDPKRLRSGIQKAIAIIDEITASPKAFKAWLNTDPVWGEARAENPELQAALADPEQVKADMEMLREIRKDLQSQLKPRELRKLVRGLRDAQQQIDDLQFEYDNAREENSLLELDSAPAGLSRAEALELPQVALPKMPPVALPKVELPALVKRLRGGQQELPTAAKAAAALNMAIWGFYGASLLANPGWMMKNVMMADPKIFASGPARQVAQYLGAVYLAQAKKMQSALADASSAKGHLRDAAVVNGLLTASSVLSLASGGQLDAVSLTLPAGQALMTALSANGARKA
jgi:hypothetical protein